MAITIINADSAKQSVTADLIMTDPPFEMSGKDLHSILSNYTADHLVLICSMKQLLAFSALTDYRFNFDLVLDLASPKQSKSLQQPFYLHTNVVYFSRKGIKSAFNRKGCKRSDVFTDGYFPSIIRAPRERNDEHGHAKSEQALRDILMCFDVKTVVDPFAGSGTTGLACYELGIDCTLIEKNIDCFDAMKKTFKFLGGI